MLGGVFSCQDGTQSKTATAVGIMGDGDEILWGIVGDGVDAGNLVATNVIYAEYLGRRLVETPTLFTVEILYNLLGQSNSSTGGRIQLVDVMGLYQINIVLAETIHDLCQIGVDGSEDGNAHTEVAGPEQGLALLGTCLANLLTVILHPAGTAADYLYASLPGLLVVGKSRPGGGKLDGNIGSGKLGRLKVLLIVNIDDANYLMTTTQSDFFDHAAHLSVTD